MTKKKTPKPTVKPAPAPTAEPTFLESLSENQFVLPGALVGSGRGRPLGATFSGSDWPSGV